MSTQTIERTTREQSRLAIQVAGHAVAGLSIGLDMKRLSTKPENELDARIGFDWKDGQNPDDSDWLMVAVAGAAAESKWTDLPKTADLKRLAFDGGKTIEEQLKRFPESKRAEAMQQATARAKKAVNQNFHLVKRLRTELISYNEVNQQAMDRILKHNKLYKVSG